MKHAILAAEECGKTDRVGAKLFKVNQSAVCAYTIATMKLRLSIERIYRVDCKKLPRKNYNRI